MPKTYPVALRRELIARMLAGEDFRALAAESGVRDHTLYRWKRQALIDEGQRPGLKTGVVNELTEARRRIKELETELSATRLASELFSNGGANPKGSTRL